MKEKIHHIVALDMDARTDLADFLLAHERDIAWEIDDFGNLGDVFEQVFNRKPDSSA